MEAFTPFSCLCLVQSRSLFPQLFQDLIFPKFVLHVLHAFVTLPMLCPFFPLCLTTVQQPGILFFFLQDLRSSSPWCKLRDFVLESSASLHTLNHLRHFLLVRLYLLIFLVSNQSHHFCMVSSHPGWIHALSQAAANSSETHHLLSASMLSFSSHSLLLLHLFFFRRLLLHALQTLQIVFSELGEDSCATIFSSVSYSGLPASSHTPPFLPKKKSLCLFCCPPPCTCSELLPRSSQPASSNIHLFFLTHGSPFDHFFRIFLPVLP